MEILFTKIDKKNNYEVFNSFIEQKNPLFSAEIEELIELFDKISKYWISKECKIKNLLLEYEMGFLIGWLKKKNIRKILDLINFVYSNPQIPKKSNKNWSWRSNKSDLFFTNC